MAVRKVGGISDLAVVLAAAAWTAPVSGLPKDGTDNPPGGIPEGDGT
jgi:hypothetical protein